jgi:hypothetical protein
MASLAAPVHICRQSGMFVRESERMNSRLLRFSYPVNAVKSLTCEASGLASCLCRQQKGPPIKIRRSRGRRRRKLLGLCNFTRTYLDSPAAHELSLPTPHFLGLADASKSRRLLPPRQRRIIHGTFQGSRLTKCPSITCWTSKFASARPILPDQAVWGESHDVYDGTPASQMWFEENFESQNGCLISISIDPRSKISCARADVTAQTHRRL